MLHSLLTIMFLFTVAPDSGRAGLYLSVRHHVPGPKVITLERTVCYGTCPEYKLTITITHYHGCRGSGTLELLTQLENKIDAAVNVGKWIK